MDFPMTTISGGSSPSTAPRPYLSLLDLAQHINGRDLARFRNWFMIDIRPGIPLMGSDAAWAQAMDFTGIPQEFIERQTLITITDVVLENEAIFNPLRANRVGGGR